MGKIRVLVVDDAVVVRRLVAEALSVDPDIEVVGTAANGKIGLAKVTQVNPDIITLDVEMPEMNGLQMLAEIRKTHPRLPIIMFSTLTERGAMTTLDALAAGASDYVTKPANVGSINAGLQRVRDELIPKIKALCGRNHSPPASQPTSVRRPAGVATTLSAADVRFPFAIQRPIEILAIGVSTGGPNALAELIPILPATFPVPVVIVQHMPPIFTRLLAERLNAKSALRVREAAPEEPLKQGDVWIAPGDFHMAVRKQASGTCLNLTQAPPENSCRPAVDVLFRAVAQTYGGGVLAVVLTGMGQDGLRGCEAIKEAGGNVIVQDEASSVVWGMPGFVARAGLADAILPLSEIGPEIIRRFRLRGSRISLSGTHAFGTLSGGLK